MSVRNTYVDRRWAGYPTLRSYVRKQNGFTGNHSTPLPYVGYEASASFISGNKSSRSPPDAAADPLLSEFLSTNGVPAWASTARRKAYEEFRNKALGDSSQLGATFAEWRESLGMIGNRLTGLYDSYRSLRRGDFRSFLRNLSVSPRKRHANKIRNGASEVSGLWLEYWFGWAPMCSDIYGGFQVMEKDHPVGELAKGVSMARFDSEKKVDSNVIWDSRHAVLYIKTGGRCRLVNPNLFLLSQLGLANPLQVAWEIVPFSFFVDWVTGAGTYIESFTDFLGVEVSETYSMSYIKYQNDVTMDNWPGHAGWVSTFRTSGHALTRGTSVLRPIPNLQFTANLGQSKTRAASAASLLIQIITGTRSLTEIT